MHIRKRKKIGAKRGSKIMLRSQYNRETGAYAPSKVLTNFDLEKLVDTSDEWIMERTGIRERRIAAEDEATSDLSIKAANNAKRWQVSNLRILI